MTRRTTQSRKAKARPTGTRDHHHHNPGGHQATQVSAPPDRRLRLSRRLAARELKCYADTSGLCPDSSRFSQDTRKILALLTREKDAGSSLRVPKDSVLKHLPEITPVPQSRVDDLERSPLTILLNDNEGSGSRATELNEQWVEMWLQTHRHHSERARGGKKDAGNSSKINGDDLRLAWKETLSDKTPQPLLDSDRWKTSIDRVRAWIQDYDVQVDSLFQDIVQPTADELDSRLPMLGMGAMVSAVTTLLSVTTYQGQEFCLSAEDTAVLLDVATNKPNFSRLGKLMPSFSPSQLERIRNELNLILGEIRQAAADQIRLDVDEQVWGPLLDFTDEVEERMGLEQAELDTLHDLDTRIVSFEKYFERHASAATSAIKKKREASDSVEDILQDLDDAFEDYVATMLDSYDDWMEQVITSISMDHRTQMEDLIRFSIDTTRDLSHRLKQMAVDRAIDGAHWETLKCYCDELIQVSRSGSDSNLVPEHPVKWLTKCHELLLRELQDRRREIEARLEADKEEYYNSLDTVQGRLAKTSNRGFRKRVKKAREIFEATRSGILNRVKSDRHWYHESTLYKQYLHPLLNILVLESEMKRQRIFGHHAQSAMALYESSAKPVYCLWRRELSKGWWWGKSIGMRSLLLLFLRSAVSVAERLKSPFPESKDQFPAKPLGEAVAGNMNENPKPKHVRTRGVDTGVVKSLSLEVPGGNGESRDAAEKPSSDAEEPEDDTRGQMKGDFPVVHPTDSPLQSENHRGEGTKGKVKKKSGQSLAVPGKEVVQTPVSESTSTPGKKNEQHAGIPNGKPKSGTSKINPSERRDPLDGDHRRSGKPPPAPSQRLGTPKSDHRRADSVDSAKSSSSTRRRVGKGCSPSKPGSEPSTLQLTSRETQPSTQPMDKKTTEGDFKSSLGWTVVGAAKRGPKSPKQHQKPPKNPLLHSNHKINPAIRHVQHRTEMEKHATEKPTADRNRAERGPEVQQKAVATFPHQDSSLSTAPPVSAWKPIPSPHSSVRPSREAPRRQGDSNASPALSTKATASENNLTKSMSDPASAAPRPAPDTLLVGPKPVSDFPSVLPRPITDAACTGTEVVPDSRCTIPLAAPDSVGVAPQPVSPPDQPVNKALSASAVDSRSGSTSRVSAEASTAENNPVLSCILPRHETIAAANDPIMHASQDARLNRNLAVGGPVSTPPGVRFQTGGVATGHGKSQTGRGLPDLVVSTDRRVASVLEQGMPSGSFLDRPPNTAPLTFGGHPRTFGMSSPFDPNLDSLSPPNAHAHRAQGINGNGGGDNWSGDVLFGASPSLKADGLASVGFSDEESGYMQSQSQAAPPGVGDQVLNSSQTLLLRVRQLKSENEQLRASFLALTEWGRRHEARYLQLSERYDLQSAELNERNRYNQWLELRVQRLETQVVALSSGAASGGWSTTPPAPGSQQQMMDGSPFLRPLQLGAAVRGGLKVNPLLMGNPASSAVPSPTASLSLPLSGAPVTAPPMMTLPDGDQFHASSVASGNPATGNSPSTCPT